MTTYMCSSSALAAINQTTYAGVVPSATLATCDGRWVIVGGNGDSVYTRLMAAVGRPDMGAHNPLYANNAARCRREGEIYEARLCRLWPLGAAELGCCGQLMVLWRARPSAFLLG